MSVHLQRKQWWGSFASKAHFPEHTPGISTSFVSLLHYPRFITKALRSASFPSLTKSSDSTSCCPYLNMATTAVFSAACDAKARRRAEEELALFELEQKLELLDLQKKLCALRCQEFVEMLETSMPVPPTEDPGSLGPNEHLGGCFYYKAHRLRRSKSGMQQRRSLSQMPSEVSRSRSTQRYPHRRHSLCTEQ